MTTYLLSVYQPDGEPPPPEVLKGIMHDVDDVRRELKAAGAWVFAGGLHATSTATVLRSHKGEVLMTDGPFVEGREHWAASTSSKHPTSMPRSSGVASSLGRPRSPLRCDRSVGKTTAEDLMAESPSVSTEDIRTRLPAGVRSCGRGPGAVVR